MAKYNKERKKIIYSSYDEYVLIQKSRSFKSKPFEFKRAKLHFGPFNIVKKHINKNSSILDAGCRNGLFIGLAKHYGYNNVYGLDIVERNIKCCLDNGYNVKIGDCEKLSEIYNIKFDLIYCRHMLEHVRNPEKAIEEFYKCLNENGILFIVIPLQKKGIDVKLGHSFVFNIGSELINMTKQFKTVFYNSCRVGSAREFWYIGKK